MIRKSLILIFSVCLIIKAHAQIEWSKPISVAPSTFGKARPIVKLVNDTTPVVMWSSGGTKDIFFSKWEGDQFSFPQIINGSASNVMVYNWAGAEMDTYEDDIFVTFRTNPWSGGYSYMVKSTDGGATWSDTLHIEPTNYGKKTYFPAPSVITNNKMVVTYMHHDGNDNDPQYARIISNDGGETWSDTLDISRQFGAEACDCCSPLIAGNGANQLIAFRNNDNNLREFKALLSTDSGQTFTQPITVDTTGWTINACPSSTISGILQDSTFLSVYMSKSEVYLAQSNLNTGELMKLQPVASNALSKNYPKIESNGDSVIVVWEQAGNNTDLYYTIFDADLSNYNDTNYFVLTDSADTQTKPSIAYANDGTIHIVYADRLTNTVIYMNNRPVLVEEDTTSTNDTTSNNDTTTNNDSTSLLERNVVIEFEITPNPSSNQIHIPFTNIRGVMLFDASGKSYEAVAENGVVNIQHLATGVYNIAVLADDKYYKSSFVKR